MRHTVAAEQRDMRGEQHDQQCRKQAGVKGEKASQRVMSIVRAADQKLLKGRPGHRYNSHDLCGYLGCPIPLFVPGQQVARKRQTQNHER